RRRLPASPRSPSPTLFRSNGERRVRPQRERCGGPLHVASRTGADVQLAWQLLPQQLRPARRARGSSHGPASNQLGLGGRKLARVANRPSVWAQLPRLRSLWWWSRVPATPPLAARHHQLRCLLRSRSLVSLYGGALGAGRVAGTTTLAINRPITIE